MKKFLPIVFVILILTGGYLALRAIPNRNPRPARPVKIAGSDWEPFIGPNMENDGPLGVIISETFQHMGLEPQITYASWDLIQEQAGRGEVLGAFPLIISSARLEKFEPSDPLIPFDYVLFYNKANVPNAQDIQTASDLEGYTFGKVSGYEVWTELEAAVPQFDKEYDTSLEAFQDLAAGNIHFLPEGRLAGLVIINGPNITADKEEIGHLDPKGNPLLGATEGLHFMMPKGQDSTRFLQEFNAALATVKETSIYKESRAQIETALENNEIVQLNPISGQEFVSAHSSLENGQIFQLPLGTRAVVIEWADAFTGGETAESNGRLLSKVKILNGPQRGRVVMVDSRNITILP